MAAANLTKKATLAFSQSIGDVKRVYMSQKAAIEKAIPIAPGVYSGAISMVYAVIKMPESYFSRMFGTIPGMAFSYMYSSVVAPVRGALALFDLRTLKGFFATIWYFVVDCLPKAINKTFTYMLKGLADYFKVAAKAIKGVKKVKSLQKRQMLTESKSALLEGKIWDWFKSTMYSIALKFKDAAWWLLKKGFSVIEKPFMKVVYPLTQCMSKNNHLAGTIPSSIFSSNKLLKYMIGALGIGGALNAVGSVTFGGIAIAGMLSSFLWFMGIVATVFTVATWLNVAGNFLDMKNMLTDVFS